MTIRVLVVNDSATARAALRAAMTDEPDIEVVGELRSGSDAVASVESLAPDVVLMDIVMPDVDGYEVTRQILRARPVPVLMISASVAPGDVAVAMDALRAGAIAVLEAPPTPNDPRYDVRRRAIIHTIRSAAALPRKNVDRMTSPRPTPQVEVGPGSRSFEIVGMVASLGGPPVVADILSHLVAGHPPILLVQHIETSFVTGFVTWLRGAVRTKMVLAESGMLLERGTVYVPPGDHHIGASADGRVLLSTAPQVAGFRPSGSHLLSSLARTYGKRALGIVLTGMGTDGADGALALHQAGGFVIAQDEASCAVAGMPNTARKRGAVDLTVTPGAVAAHIR
jgi:two-component system chemotaxis response regulator CheB